MPDKAEFVICDIIIIIIIIISFRFFDLMHRFYFSGPISECWIVIFFQDQLLRLTASFPGLPQWVSRYQKSKTTLDLNKARDNGVWGSAGPHANNLHLAPDR